MVKIDGRESLLRSTDLFANRDVINQIHVVVEAAQLEGVKAKYGAHFAFTGIKLASATGGWWDQLAAADAKIPADVTHVLVHDAARPCVPGFDIDAILEAAPNASAAALATPLRATLVETDPGNNPVAIHSPSAYHLMMTPIIYKRAEFAAAVKARQEIHASKLTLVAGSPLNVRVGGVGDEKLIRALLGVLPKPKSKIGGAFDEAQW